MEKNSESSEKKIVELNTKGRKVSKFVWFPFLIMFLVTLGLFLLTFAEATPWAEKIPIKIKFSENAQLILLGILVSVSLLLPFWAYSINAPKSRINAPLGLPQGSIRAIILLIAAIAYLILTIRGNALEDARNIFILVAVLYYFSRSNEISSVETS